MGTKSTVRQEDTLHKSVEIRLVAVLEHLCVFLYEGPVVRWSVQQIKRVRV